MIEIAMQISIKLKWKDLYKNITHDSAMYCMALRAIPAPTVFFLLKSLIIDKS